MGIRFCVLGSGSSGNCTLVASEKAALLIDAGLSGREICGRLGAVGFRLEDVAAVCLTHEHDDHVAGLNVLHRRHKIPLYANTATVDAMSLRGKCDGLQWAVFTTGSAFQIADITIEPFTVPHDSYDPVGFVLGNGEDRLAVLTDIGMPTSLVREKLRRCSAMVVESNHDEKLLRDSDRPWQLKQRIAGRQGHLSNAQAGKLVAEAAGARLKTVVLAHLSCECNTPDLAIAEMRRALAGIGRTDVEVFAACPDRPTSLFSAAAGAEHVDSTIAR